MIHRGCASCVSLHAFARGRHRFFSRRKLRWKLAARACDFTGSPTPRPPLSLYLSSSRAKVLSRSLAGCRVSGISGCSSARGGANALNSGKERPRNADIFTSRFIDRPTNTTINCIHVHVTYRPRARAREEAEPCNAPKGTKKPRD